MAGWFILGAVVQIVVATLAAIYASGKDRDGAVWFLIALAIGPVAFIPLYLFDLPPVRTPSERDMEAIAQAIAKANRQAG